MTLVIVWFAANWFLFFLAMYLQGRACPSHHMPEPWNQPQENVALRGLQFLFAGSFCVLIAAWETSHERHW